MIHGIILGPIIFIGILTAVLNKLIHSSRLG